MKYGFKMLFTVSFFFKCNIPGRMKPRRPVTFLSSIFASSFSLSSSLVIAEKVCFDVTILPFAFEILKQNQLYMLDTSSTNSPGGFIRKDDLYYNPNEWASNAH